MAVSTILLLSRSTQHWIPCIIYIVYTHTVEKSLYIYFSPLCVSQSLNSTLVSMYIVYIYYVQPLNSAQHWIPSICTFLHWVFFKNIIWPNCVFYHYTFMYLTHCRNWARYYGAIYIGVIYNVLNPVRYSGVMSRLLSIGHHNSPAQHSEYHKHLGLLVSLCYNHCTFTMC